MTSSGRRVKRRNFDENEGNQPRNSKPRKSKSGRKNSRKKTSKSKSLRPQRAAALNALNLFSKITGTSIDGEDEDGSEVETSDSESALPDSNVDSDGSDHYIQNEQRKHMKGKEISVDESEDLTEHHKVPELQMSAGKRARLVLKLPNKHLIRENRDELVAMSSKVPQEVNETSGTCVNSQKAMNSPLNHGGLEGLQLDKAELLSLTDGYRDGQKSWGGVKARSTKRLRLGEATTQNAFSRTNLSFRGFFEKDNNLIGDFKTKGDSVGKLAQKHEVDRDGVLIANEKNMDDGTNGRANGMVHSRSFECEISDKALNSQEMAACDATTSSVDDKADFPSEQTDSIHFGSTKLRLKRTARDPDSACEHETRSSLESLENGICDSLTETPLGTEQDSGVPKNDMANGVDSNHEVGALVEFGIQSDKNTSAANDSSEPHQHRNRMFSAVYRRSKSHKRAAAVEGSTSNASNQNLSVDSREGSIDGSCRTPSIGLKASAESPDAVVDDDKLDQGLDSGYKHRNTPNGSRSRNQLPHEEWGSSSRMTVGLRSTRNRRGSYHVRETSPIDVRRSNKSSRRATWLMLSTHEGGSRYIPQLSDEVAYLRQGHQEYLLEHNRARETPPWTSMEGEVREVEFCKVQKLDYSTLPGSGESCCKMTLEFIDPASAVYGQSFKITLPEMTGFPDFLVERTRYDASIQRNWTHRDKCKVWWKNEGEEDGSWWFGRILYVKPKSSDFPDSPWERYSVQYKSDPAEPHAHSPWELFDINVLWEHNHIDDESKTNLLSAFASLVKSSKPPQDRFGINKLKQLSQKANFANRFPVPISLELIESRLENDYYRSREAMKHDFEIMLSNAEQYLGNKSEISTKLKRLTDWLTKTLSFS